MHDSQAPSIGSSSQVLLMLVPRMKSEWKLKMKDFGVRDEWLWSPAAARHTASNGFDHCQWNCPNHRFGTWGLAFWSNSAKQHLHTWFYKSRKLKFNSQEKQFLSFPFLFFWTTGAFALPNESVSIPYCHFLQQQCIRLVALSVNLTGSVCH